MLWYIRKLDVSTLNNLKDSILAIQYTTYYLYNVYK